MRKIGGGATPSIINQREITNLSYGLIYGFRGTSRLIVQVLAEVTRKLIVYQYYIWLNVMKKYTYIFLKNNTIM